MFCYRWINGANKHNGYKPNINITPYTFYLKPNLKPMKKEVTSKGIHYTIKPYPSNITVFRRIDDDTPIYREVPCTIEQPVYLNGWNYNGESLFSAINSENIDLIFDEDYQVTALLSYADQQ